MQPHTTPENLITPAPRSIPKSMHFALLKPLLLWSLAGLVTGFMVLNKNENPALGEAFFFFAIMLWVILPSIGLFISIQSFIHTKRLEGIWAQLLEKPKFSKKKNKFRAKVSFKTGNKQLNMFVEWPKAFQPTFDEGPNHIFGTTAGIVSNKFKLLSKTEILSMSANPNASTNQTPREKKPAGSRR